LRITVIATLTMLVSSTETNTPAIRTTSGSPHPRAEGAGAGGDGTDERGVECGVEAVGFVAVAGVAAVVISM
jgi:hypothetical protein